jgi:hypothetical protein
VAVGHSRPEHVHGITVGQILDGDMEVVPPEEGQHLLTVARRTRRVGASLGCGAEKLVQRLLRILRHIERHVATHPFVSF